MIDRALAGPIIDHLLHSILAALLQASPLGTQSHSLEHRLLSEPTIHIAAGGIP